MYPSPTFSNGPLFPMNVLTQRVQATAMVIGMLTGVGALAWIWTTGATAWTWYALIGSGVTFAVAVLASAIIDRK